MPRRAGKHVPAASTARGRRLRKGRGASHVLRATNLLTSTLRETLGSKLLAETTPAPVTVPQVNLLQLISLGGHHHMGEVAAFLGVSPPAATKTIDKLERLGLLARSTAAADRRTTYISASTKGRELARRYQELQLERITPALAGFRQEELEHIAELIERLATALLADEPRRPDPCLRCGSCIVPGCPIGALRGGCPFEESHSPPAGGATEVTP